jgi:hypothetical protein
MSTKLRKTIEGHQSTNSETAWVSKTKAGVLIQQTPGTGRKQCPACKFFVGPTNEVCPNPDCGHKFVKADKAARPTPRATSTNTPAATIDQVQFIKVMIGKGWKYEKMVNAFTDEVIKETVPPQIEKLGLKFEAIPKNADGVYITQTNQQIQVAMPLDKFLEIAGLKP